MNPADLKMDATSLYREDVYTDRKIGTIRVMTPVTSLGGADSARPVIYVGETQLLTSGGLLPLAFQIEARSLAEAVEKFAEGANEAVERTRREIERLHREATSSIITTTPRLSRRWGAAACVTKKLPFAVAPRAASQSSSVSSTTGLIVSMPALLTSMSSRPNSV